jgi:signal transduction histidine kinase
MFSLETTLYYAILAGSAVLAFIIFCFAGWAYRQQRKVVRLQRHYFLHDVGLLENERTRISRDLHDSVGTDLTIMQFLLSGLEMTDEAAQSKLGKVHLHLDRILQSLGQITRDLSFKLLENKGLHFVLQDLLEDVAAASGIGYQLHYQLLQRPDAALSMHLYRIIKEMVHNTLKHSEATTLLVHLKERKGKLYLLCEDNGKGFSDTPESTGHGLHNIRSRIAMLGGKMECCAPAGKGTRYFCEIPLLKPKLHD